MNNIAQIHSHIFYHIPKKKRLWNLPWIFVPLYPGKGPFSIARGMLSITVLNLSQRSNQSLREAIVN